MFTRKSTYVQQGIWEYQKLKAKLVSKLAVREWKRLNRTQGLTVGTENDDNPAEKTEWILVVAKVSWEQMGLRAAHYKKQVLVFGEAKEYLPTKGLQQCSYFSTTIS